MEARASTGVNASPSTSDAEIIPKMGTRRENGATILAEYLPSSLPQIPYPMTVETTPVYTIAPIPVGVNFRRAWSCPDSTQRERRKRGTGGTTQVQMTNAAMFTRPTRFMMMFATPQENPAAMMSKSPVKEEPPAMWPTSMPMPENAAAMPSTCPGGGAVVQQERRKNQGEECLYLQHQRGKARRHAHGHSHEKEGEHHHAEHETVGEDVSPRDRSFSHEQNAGKRGDREPQRRKEHGRKNVEADLDDDKVKAPDQGDKYCKKYIRDFQNYDLLDYK